MDEQAKRKVIKNYFLKIPSWTGKLLGFGVFLTIVGGILFLSTLIALIAGAGNGAIAGIVFGIIIILLSVLFIAISIRKKNAIKKQISTDKQFDECVNDDLIILQKKALEKSGVTEEQLVDKNVAIVGFPTRIALRGLFFGYRRGSDNIIRYTPIECTLLNFTENQVIAYGCVLDLATGSFLNESTDEYYYKDVVSVSTRTESKEISLGGMGSIKSNEAEIFSLTTSGGTSLTVLLRDKTLIQRLGGGEMPITEAERAIQVLRKLVREKKG